MGKSATWDTEKKKVLLSVCQCQGEAPCQKTVELQRTTCENGVGTTS
jgi:hypothetical protein